MTIQDLHDCHGYTVQVTLDGEDDFAELNFPESATIPKLIWPAPLTGAWEDVYEVPLSAAHIESFRMNGHRNIFSSLSLSSEGGNKRII